MAVEEDMQEFPVGEELVSAPPETPRRTRKTAQNSSSALPVYADLKTERAVIAALMIEPACLSTVVTILGGLSSSAAGNTRKKNSASDPDASKREMYHSQASMIFYDLKYAAVYEAVLELSEKGIAVDILSLTTVLEQSKRLEAIGGQDFLIDVQSSIASTANIESWCSSLRDYAAHLFRRSGYVPQFSGKCQVAAGQCRI